jgi:tetratricopeptide (TPR) repeat protein
MVEEQRRTFSAVAGNYVPSISQHMKHLADHPNDSRALEKYIATLEAMPQTRKELIKVMPDSRSVKKAPAKVWEECLQTLTSEPHNLDCFYRLAKAAMEARWYETAVFAFFFILRYEDRLDGHLVQAVKSEVCRAAMSLSEQYLVQRRLDEAFDVLTKARETLPSGDLDKRVLEVELRRRDVKIEDMRRAASDDGADGARRPEIDALEREKWEFVAESCRTLMKSRTTDVEVHVRLGESLYHLAREPGKNDLLKQALSHLQFRSGVVTDHCLWQSKILMGQCLVALGLPKAGELLLSQLLAGLAYTEQTKGIFLEGHRQLGMARELTGDCDGALEAYLKVIERDFGFADVLERAQTLERKRAER